MSKKNDVKIVIRAIDKITAPLRSMGNGFGKMNKNVAKATLRFKAFNDATMKTQKRLRKIGGGMKKFGRGMTTAVSAPIAAFGAVALKTTYDFEKSMNKVAALTKATGKPFQDLEKMALKLGASTQYSASNAAEAMSFLGMAGFDTNQILASTPKLLDLAAASGIELGRAADIASNVMGAFKLEAKDMGMIADVLANTTASSNVSMEMLADSMKFAAPIAKKYGLTLAETAAAVGMLGNIGVQGSMAGTGLRTMMLSLTAPAGKAAKILKYLNVETKDAAGNMRPLTETMADFGNSLKDLPEGQQLEAVQTIFGKIGMTSAMELIDKAASGDLAKFNEKIKNSNGVAAQMAKTMNRGMVGAFKNLASASEGAMIAIGKNGGMVELFNSIAAGLTKVAAWISKLSPGVLKFGVIMGGIAALLGPVIIFVGMLVSALAALAPIAAFIGVSLGALAGGIIAIPLAIGAAVAGIYIFWDEIVAFIGGAWDWIESKIGRLAYVILALPLGLFAAGVAIYVFWDEIKAFIGGVWDWIAKKIASIGALVGKFAKILGFGGGDTAVNIDGSKGDTNLNLGSSEVVQGAAKSETKNAKVTVMLPNMPKGAKSFVEADSGLDFDMFTGQSFATE